LLLDVSQKTRKKKVSEEIYSVDTRRHVINLSSTAIKSTWDWNSPSSAGQDRCGMFNAQPKAAAEEGNLIRPLFFFSSPMAHHPKFRAGFR
jgi:hypothetical protein